MPDISKHFSRSEFACKCGCGFDMIDLRVVALCEQIRSYFGKPVTINCGCRCKTHNAEVGGEIDSQHLFGKAADIVVAGVDAKAVADYAEKINPNGGVGRYPKKHFTHIDVRGRRARWIG